MLPATLALLLLMQVPNTRHRTPQQQAGGIKGSDTEAIATFTGVFKGADKKFVNIEVESGETMRMYITGSTKFVRDGKPAHAKDFEPGENVTADASRDARLNLLAVRIELAPKPAKAATQVR